MSNKAIFLDRDDTLIKDQGYLDHPDQVALLDGVPEALIELKSLGYKLVVVSNQSAVARGIVSEQALGRIHERLEHLLGEMGAGLDRIYYCPYHPDGVIDKYRRQSDMRKPDPGMLLTAADEMDISLDQSWMIGNSDSDIQAGRRAGCKTIRIDSSPVASPPTTDVAAPDYTATNIREAVNIIKSCHRQSETTGDTDAENRGEAMTQSVQSPEPVTRQDHQPIEPAAQDAEQPQPAGPEDRTDELLKSILEQLRSIHRTDMFHEFSTTRLVAGILQILAVFCMVVTIWLLVSPSRSQNSVLTALGFAAVLQLMSLTFYIMQGQK